MSAVWKYRPVSVKNKTTENCGQTYKQPQEVHSKRLVRDITPHRFYRTSICKRLSHSIPFVARQRRSYSSVSEVRQSIMAEPQRVTDPLQDSASRLKQQNTQKNYFYRRVLPQSCVPFGSEEGKKMFTDALLAGYMECYFELAAQFRTQDEPAFCGLSTLVMALNALAVDPKRVWKGVWRWYHEYMLDCCVPIKLVEQQGITFDQFACLAACNSLNVQMVRGDDQLTEERLREEVKVTSRTTDKVMVASYSRKTLGQTGDGHFSPIGGYHPDSDQVLILDTARFKYPPHWIKLATLCEAMKASDLTTGQPRGYMVLRKAETEPPVLFHVSPSLGVNSELQSIESGLSAFLHSWNGWLQEEATDLSDSAMWEAAISQILNALECINFDHLLATQGYLNCSMSEEHTCAVRELIQNLEQLDLFTTVQEQLKLYKSNSPSLSPVSTYAVCDTLHCGATDCQTCGFRLDSQECHFLTMLLLAWPYTKCGGNHSNILGRSVNSSMVNCSGVLQNEVTQLRSQLGSVLGYISTCNNCQCRV